MSLDFSLTATIPTQVFDWNITHNLAEMASEAGIYEVLWQPKKNGYNKAKDISPVLDKGLELLRAEPDRFKKYDPNNGWGDYKGLVKFVVAALEACNKYPDADINT